MSRLVVVSNRIAPPDEHAASAGGLAVGILGALKTAGGLWFGWSGETGNEDQPLKKVKKEILPGPLLTSVKKISTNTTTNSPMPFSGRHSITDSIWCNFSVQRGKAIYA